MKYNNNLDGLKVLHKNKTNKEHYYLITREGRRFVVSWNIDGKIGNNSYEANQILQYIKEGSWIPLEYENAYEIY